LKTLIINNYFDAEKSSKVVEAIAKFSGYKILRYNEVFEILTKTLTDVDAVILTGSEARIVKKEHVKMFNNIIKIIKNCNTPMLGICFGHQLICLSFGAEVASLKAPVKNRFEKVKILKLNELFKGFKEGDSLWLAEYHNDYVKRDSLKKADLELLAESQSCEVEAVKHRKKPFYGIQFHAEKITIENETHPEGLKILKNFLDYAHK
jgi:GMP synthase-like glutamine amidotransferase